VDKNTNDSIISGKIHISNSGLSQNSVFIQYYIDTKILQKQYLPVFIITIIIIYSLPTSYISGAVIAFCGT
jgi:hypothetical protein